jgi:O-antigen ligase
VLVQLGRITAGARVDWRRFAVVSVALVLTISRSAAVGTIAGLGVVLAARGLSRRLVRVAAVAGSLFLLVSPLLLRYALAYHKFSLGEGTSAGARLTNWLIVLRIIGDYPWFGVGFNAYKFAAQDYGANTIGPSSYAADGGLLFITALTGIVGIAVYCAMLGLVIRRCRSIWRDATLPPNERGLAIGTAAATVGIAICSFFVNAILTTFIMQMLWVLWGLTFVIARARDRRARQHAPPPGVRILAIAA